MTNKERLIEAARKIAEKEQRFSCPAIGWHNAAYKARIHFTELFGPTWLNAYNHYFDEMPTKYPRGSGITFWSGGEQIQKNQDIRVLALLFAAESIDAHTY